MNSYLVWCHEGTVAYYTARFTPISEPEFEQLVLEFVEFKIDGVTPVVWSDFTLQGPLNDTLAAQVKSIIMADDYPLQGPDETILSESAASYDAKASLMMPTNYSDPPS